MANFFSRFITAISRKLSALIKRVVAVASPRRPSAPPPIINPPRVAKPPPSRTELPPSAAEPLPGAGKPIVQALSESVPVPDTFTVERIENGYRASGPLESGWHINVGIEGDTVRSYMPFLKGTDPNGTDDWPFEWTDRDPNWLPAEPPVKWFLTHSDYQPHLDPPIGGIKWIYQGSIDADGTSSTGETVVEVHTQAKEDARRAKQREMRKRGITG